MPALVSFQDFMSSTGPAFIKSPEQLQNDAVQNNYIWGLLTKGKGLERTIKAGSTLKDTAILLDSITAQQLSPNGNFSVPNPQVNKTIELPWTFTIDSMSWTEQEAILNSGGDLFTFYKNLKRIKETRLWNSMNGYMDRMLFGNVHASDAYARMEGTSATDPLSIHAIITEQGRSTARGWRGSVPTGWTNVAGLPAGTLDNWTCGLTFYDRNADVNAAGTLNAQTYGVNAAAAGAFTVFGLLTGMDDLWSKVSFRAPLVKGEFFSTTDVSKQMILCSRLGKNLYRRALRASNDLLSGSHGRQDASYDSPMYNGVPLVEVAAWNDDATGSVWPAAASSVADTLSGRNNTTTGHTVTGGGTETGANTIDKGPRFMFVSGENITPVLNAEKWMKKDAPRQPDGQTSWYQTVQTWWNLFPNSRLRHGILAPQRVS